MSRNAMNRFCWMVPEPGREFRWFRLVNGEQQWAKKDPSSTEAGWLLGMHGEESPSARLIRYFPLEEETALFRIFAELEPGAASVRQFATRYGSLTVEGKPVRGPKEKEEYESITLWVDRISRMKALVHMWDSIRARDQVSLAQFVEWINAGEKPKNQLRGPPGPLGMIQAIDRIIEITPKAIIRFGISGDNPAIAIVPGDDQKYGFIPGDLVRPASYFLAEQLTLEMERNVGCVFIWDPERNRCFLESHPRDLLGAMYLQFAQAVAENKDYRHCVVCNKWMELSPQANRADRLTCSNSCRMIQYRQRQERARELHKQGMKPAKIAKELDSDVDTVKGWITMKKGK